MIQAGAGITMAYDGDGNRVSKTAGGGTIKYLVDPQNPTGYAQVLQETFGFVNNSSREGGFPQILLLDRIPGEGFVPQGPLNP